MRLLIWVRTKHSDLPVRLEPGHRPRHRVPDDMGDPIGAGTDGASRCAVAVTYHCSHDAQTGDLDAVGPERRSLLELADNPVRRCWRLAGGTALSSCQYVAQSATRPVWKSIQVASGATATRPTSVSSFTWRLTSRTTSVRSVTARSMRVRRPARS